MVLHAELLNDRCYDKRVTPSMISFSLRAAVTKYEEVRFDVYIDKTRNRMDTGEIDNRFLTELTEQSRRSIPIPDERTQTNPQSQIFRKTPPKQGSDDEDTSPPKDNY